MKASSAEGGGKCPLLRSQESGRRIDPSIVDRDSSLGAWSSAQRHCRLL